MIRTSKARGEYEIQEIIFIEVISYLKVVED